MAEGIGAGAEAAASSELEAQGGASLDTDWQSVAEAAAGGAAAAACAAYGLAAAAPLCAYVGSEVAAWASENVVGPVVDFVGGLFGSEPEPPSLIEFASPWAAAMAYLEDDYWEPIFEGWAQSLVLLAYQLGIPSYSLDDAIADLHQAGLELYPRSDDFVQGDYYIQEIRDGVPVWNSRLMRGPLWVPPWRSYALQRYGQDVTAAELEEYGRQHVDPWASFAVNEAIPAVVAALETRAVGLAAERAMLEALAALSDDEREELRQLAALQALNPEDQAALAALSEEERAELRELRDAGLTPEAARLLAMAEMDPADWRMFDALRGVPMEPAERAALLERYAVGADPDPSAKKAAVGLGGASLLAAAPFLLL